MVEVANMWDNDCGVKGAVWWSKTPAAEEVEMRDACGGGGDMVRWRNMIIAREEMWYNDDGLWGRLW